MNPSAAAAEDGGEPPTDTGCASIADIEFRFAAKPLCPRCRSTKAVKWGSASGLKRYRCKDCKATFNALTGTALAQLHKRELWTGQAQALAGGISLRKVAARLDVHLTTAFAGGKHAAAAEYNDRVRYRKLCVLVFRGGVRKHGLQLGQGGSSLRADQPLRQNETDGRRGS